MESAVEPPNVRPAKDAIRISTSPGRSPQITEALDSPARSVHPQVRHMGSVDSKDIQQDFGLRNVDFFDKSSDDGSTKAINAHNVEANDQFFSARGSVDRSRQSGPPDEPLASQCVSNSPTSTVRLGTKRYQHLSTNRYSRHARTPSSSFVDSVDEVVSADGSPLQFPSRARVTSGRWTRDSATLECLQKSASSQLDQTLLPYEIAHGITLQALMRDKSFPRASVQAGNQPSMLPPLLHDPGDPRSPRNRISLPPTDIYKKVHVVPPPIDTTAARHTLPANLVRTPYPHQMESPRHKEFNGNPLPTSSSMRTTLTESVLTLSIRQTNPNSRRRVTTLIIPASNDFSAVRNKTSRSKEHHFKALDFDDAVFFQELRKSYHQLIGPIRFLGARSLRRIVVSGPAMKEADQGYWIHSPRSPRMLAYRGLSDSFNEEQILQHYGKPALGKSRYAFVHWAHRLAAASPVRTPRPDEDELPSGGSGPDLIRRMEQPEGLEFVMCWSVTRIANALWIVFSCAMAAALCWMFLGKTTPAALPVHGGFRDAGDRITSGIVVGICVLLLGMSGIVGWLGISWLVM